MVEQHQSPVFALREVSRLLAEVIQAHRRRAPIALREVTPLLAAAKPLIAIVEQHQSPVFALREVTPLLAAAKPLIAIVEQHQSPVFALREVSLLLAPAQRRRVQIAVQANGMVTQDNLSALFALRAQKAPP